MPSSPGREDDIVYALHDFDAENVDELSFAAGEAIIVLERDDQYGDGWFQGRNKAGEIGLFPQSYTSPSPPTDSPELSPTTNGAHTPDAVLDANMHDVQRALDQLKVNHDGRADGASLRSQNSRDDRHSDDEGPVANPRAVLAAKAAENAQRAAQEEKDRAEQRRKDDEAAYERQRADNDGLIEGLQLSDESDDEDGYQAMTGPAAALLPLASAPTAASKAVSHEVEAPSVAASAPPPALLETSPSKSTRSRADTATSADAESTYSALETPAAPPVVPPTLAAPAASPTLPSVAPSPPIPSPGMTKDVEPTEEVTPGPSPRATTPNGPAALAPSTSHSLSPALLAGAMGAGAAGLAAGTFASRLSLRSDTEGLDSPTKGLEQPMAAVAVPSSLGTAASIPRNTSPSPFPLSHSAQAPAALNGTSAVHSVTAKPVSAPVPTPASLIAAPLSKSVASPTQDFHDSPAASLTSATHSRSSSRLGTAPLTAASTGTGETSPRESAFGSSGVGAGAALPFDPRTWGVEEVVDWARMKGFDQLTLIKFKEHEISGDVLLEMDVAMLKEIDLTAFGRRVHIYNAIKELKARVSPPSEGQPSSASRPTSIAQSPALSGYDPDSPGTTMSFASPAPYPASPTDYPISPDGREVLNKSTHGLGLEEEGLSKSQGSRSLSTSNSRSLRGTTKTQSSSTSLGHKRSTTVDSLATTNDGTLDEPIPEEEEEGAMGPPLSKPTPIVIPARRSTQASKSTRPTSTAGSMMSDVSSKSSPNASKKPKSERGFFSTTLGRARKPPPKEPSSLEPSKPNLAENRANRTRMALSSSQSSRRSTRLFGAFSSGSEREKGTNSDSVRRQRVLSTGPSNDGTTSMSPKAVDVATPEMSRSQPDAVTSGNLLEKIGSPDYSGWMQKRGEKYNTWKQRFFVLKGIHLYYLKSEGEQKVKGFINLTGYRVISDADIHVGQFGFKIVHDSERAHYFSAAEQVTVRNWMKEIMKATIGRDYSTAVVSSCNIETMPLAVAQSMSPRPRPPSPASRARVQKERYAGNNPNTLTPKDALILMEFSGSPLLGSTSPTMGSFAGAGSTFPSVSKRESSLGESGSTKSPKAASSPKLASTKSNGSSSSPLIDYVNSHLPPSVARVGDLGESLRSGRVLVRLLEELSDTDSDISEASFAKFVPPTRSHAFDPAYFDVIFEVFDFISPLVSTDEISMDDMLSGNEPQLSLLVERIKTAYPA